MADVFVEIGQVVITSLASLMGMFFADAVGRQAANFPDEPL